MRHWLACKRWAGWMSADMPAWFAFLSGLVLGGAMVAMLWWLTAIRLSEIASGQ